MAGGEGCYLRCFVAVGEGCYLRCFVAGGEGCYLRCFVAVGFWTGELQLRLQDVAFLLFQATLQPTSLRILGRG